MYQTSSLFRIYFFKNYSLYISMLIIIIITIIFYIFLSSFSSRSNLREMCGDAEAFPKTYSRLIHGVGEARLHLISVWPFESMIKGRPPPSPAFPPILSPQFGVIRCTIVLLCPSGSLNASANRQLYEPYTPLTTFNFKLDGRLSAP